MISIWFGDWTPTLAVEDTDPLPIHPSQSRTYVLGWVGVTWMLPPAAGETPWPLMVQEAAFWQAQVSVEAPGGVMICGFEVKLQFGAGAGTTRIDDAGVWPPLSVQVTM